MPRRRKDVPDSRGHQREKPHQRNAANARERARMRILSRAFSRLKTTLPWVPADTKLSKLDTLRLATSYIAHLRTLLYDEPPSKTNQLAPHPIGLSWPFSFNKSHNSRENDGVENPPSCEPFNHNNQNSNHHVICNNSSANSHYNNGHHHQHINRYYGEEMQDYFYTNSDVFQIS